MKIPTEISPNRIKEAFIEVRYVSKVAPEIALGLFFNSLDQSYNYTNRPIGKTPEIENFKLTANQHFEIKLGGQPIFYNDRIKIEFKQNIILINCLNEYISWKVYEPEISKVLKQLAKANVIEGYSRVGVRFISEYPNIDLEDCLKFTFSFGMPEIKSETYSFSSEFKVDNLRVILKLNNKLPMFTSKSSIPPVDVIPISRIDIDIIKENMIATDIAEILIQINSNHAKEKEIFFNILKENFLKTLNPKY